MVSVTRDLTKAIAVTNSMLTGHKTVLLHIARL